MATRVHLVGRESLPHEDCVYVEPAERRHVIVQVIRSARKRLILSLFRCSDIRILGELAAAVRRGVRVEVLLTPRAHGWRRKLEDLSSLLESMGVHVCTYSRPGIKYHAKYIVADAGFALIASLNLTRKCFRDTCDFVLTTRDRNVVGGLHSLFEADCSRSGASFPESTSSRLIVGPEQTRTGIASLLLEARRTIRIIDHRISDPSMAALLKLRQAQGIVVETLERHALGAVHSHGKLILVDDATAMIGSIALSTPSLDFRRELAIVIRDPNCVRKLNGLFRKLAGLAWSGLERVS